MHKEPSHRYDMWSLARNDAAGSARPASLGQRRLQHFAPDQTQINVLDDLGTSLLLYGYGLPIEAMLKGIFTLPDGRATDCKTKKISSESVDLIFGPSANGSPNNSCEKIQVGSPVKLELDEIGAFGGVVSSQRSGGFQVSVDSGSRVMVGTKLAHIASKRGISPKASIAAGQSVTRIEPNHKDCNFEDHMGILRKGKIINLSQIDALVRASTVPQMPAIIVFEGRRPYPAEVTSTFEIGFLARFCKPIPADEFSVDMRFLRT